MKMRDEVAANKLRGGFYTPAPLVDLCMERLATLLRDRTSLRVLEPSSGDGAFLRGLARSPLGARVAFVDAVEILDTEASKSREVLQAAGLSGAVHEGSAIQWYSHVGEKFDAAFGNPPFVRFQFVSDADRQSAELLASRLGVTFRGVSNLWLPLLLGALTHLQVGGAFAFVVPAECFTGISAAVLRQWLVENGVDVRFDLFAPGSFPAVLQEVVVLSGRRRKEHAGPLRCTISEHSLVGRTRASKHSVASGNSPWTRLLLAKDHVDALEEATFLPCVKRLGDVVRFEVAAVTGANDYFSVDTSTVAAHELEPWARPLLPRVRHAPGLRFTTDDYRRAGQSGAKVHLLDFSAALPDPCARSLPSKYIELGEHLQLPSRYKCRIRSPWYRVPHIRPGVMMLSKRSHFYPRVILNDAGVVTTDTIYRGTPTPGFPGAIEDVVSAFHNSFTLLSAELEGRSFGGGVLELVPSEASRLLLPWLPGFGGELDRLDAVARSQVASDELVAETDLLLAKTSAGFSHDLLGRLGEARAELMRRRLDRNASS